MVSWGPLRPPCVCVGDLLHPGEEEKEGELGNLQEVAKGGTVHSGTPEAGWVRWEDYTWVFPSPQTFLKHALSPYCPSMVQQHRRMKWVKFRGGEAFPPCVAHSHTAAISAPGSDATKADGCLHGRAWSGTSFACLGASSIGSPTFPEKVALGPLWLLGPTGVLLPHFRPLFYLLESPCGCPSSLRCSGPCRWLPDSSCNFRIGLSGLLTLHPTPSPPLPPPGLLPRPPP